MERYKPFFTESTLSAQVDLDTENPTDEQILRTAITSEQSAINLYRQLDSLSTNENLTKVFNDIIDEEIVHTGEFEALLFKGQDGNKEVDLRLKGLDEVKDLISEDTWALSLNHSCYDKAVKILKDFQREIYGQLGDDELFDYLENAKKRIEELRYQMMRKRNVR